MGSIWLEYLRQNVIGEFLSDLEITIAYRKANSYFFSLDQNGKHFIGADPDIIDYLYENKDFSGKESPLKNGEGGI